MSTEKEQEEELRAREEWRRAVAATEKRVSKETAGFSAPPEPQPTKSETRSLNVNDLPAAQEEPSGVIGMKQPSTLDRAASSPVLNPWPRVIDAASRNTVLNPKGAAVANAEHADAEDPQNPGAEPAPAGQPAGTPVRDKFVPGGAPPTPTPEGGGPSSGGGEQEPTMQDEGRAPPSPGILVPGGMQPHTEERDVHYGKMTAPGVREALAAGGALQMDAAAIEHGANQRYFEEQKRIAELKMSANEQAALQQQRVAEDRDRIAHDRLAKIEALNKQAQGKPEDIWSNPQILGRVMGFLMLACGGAMAASTKGRNVGAAIGVASAGNLLNGLVNQDMEEKIRARTQAAKASTAETNLLLLHEKNMDNKSKAIEATKLAYFDSLLHQLEIIGADKSVDLNDANYRSIQDQILEQKAKTQQKLFADEQADIHDKEIHKYAPPHVIGGGGPGAGLSDIGNTITLSDRTSWELGDTPTAQKARERIIAMQKLQNVNDRIKALRHEAYKLDPLADKTEYGRIYGQLEDLGGQKAPLMSMALDGSTIRKDERDEIEKHNIHATEGLGIPGVPLSNKIPAWSRAHQVASDAVLDQQQALWQQGQKTEAAGAGGRQVERGYVRDEHGNLKPVAKYTGRNAAPPEHVAPRGFKPDDPARHVETQSPSLAETTPKAPDFGFQPTPAATGHKKKKEK